eukprot:2487386-Alexandrium_andersonii.AAC.1
MLMLYASCACGSNGSGYMRNVWFLICSAPSGAPIAAGARYSASEKAPSMGGAWRGRLLAATGSVARRGM